MRSILFAGGGSMGHVMVHLSVYPLLKNYVDKFYYVGSKGGLEKEKVENVFSYHEIDAVKFIRSDPFKNFGIVSRLFKAVKQAMNILKSTEPNVVFCGGGFVCVPVSIAAKRLGIPVVLHESDYSVGLANRIALRFSDKLVTTFPDTLKNHKKAVCAGPPIRRELFSSNRASALKKLGLKGEKPVLLVMGGSKGSKTINEAVERSLSDLLKKYEVLHICGNEHTTATKTDGYRRFGYISDMASVYGASDLAVSRCGSNTAFELVAMNIPTLFIPLSKKASRGDQIENARFFEKEGLSLTLKEESLETDTLKRKIDLLYDLRSRLLSNMKTRSFRGANEKIADIIKNYL